MMRYCPTCILATSAPSCPACTHPTSSWPFALTTMDRQFLASIRVAVDDAPPPETTS
jgi:hypothetical protein